MVHFVGFVSLAPFAKKPEDVERYNVPGTHIIIA